MRPSLHNDRRKPQLTLFYAGPADKDFYTVDLERVLDNRRSAARFEDVIEIKMLLDGLDGTADRNWCW